MMVPESLNPELRLMRLSARSPSTPASPQSRPNSAASGMPIVTPGMNDMSTQKIIDATRPARKPSQLFLGLVRGASLCLPNLRPNRYANESLAHTLKKIPRTKSPPHGSGSAPRTTTRPESSAPVYTAPKKLTPTSATRARVQNTYQMISASMSAKLTYTAPSRPKKNTPAGYSTAPMMPSISLGSLASERSM